MKQYNAFTRKEAIRAFLKEAQDDPEFDKIHVVRAFKVMEPGVRTYGHTGIAVYTVMYRLDDLDR